MASSSWRLWAPRWDRSRVRATLRTSVKRTASRRMPAPRNRGVAAASAAPRVSTPGRRGGRASQVPQAAEMPGTLVGIAAPMHEGAAQGFGHAVRLDDEVAVPELGHRLPGLQLALRGK